MLKLNAQGSRIIIIVVQVGAVKKDLHDNQYYLDYISTKNALYTPKIENTTTNEQDGRLYTHITTLQMHFANGKLIK
jgi:hypothetical protein